MSDRPPRSNTMGHPAETLNRLLVIRDQDRHELLARSSEAGGPGALLALDYPHLHRSLTETWGQTGLDEGDLAELTQAWLDGCERRLGLCRACPEDGGACVGDISAVKLGDQPYWEESRLLKATRCDRWERFQMSRRLERAGVETRNARDTIVPPVTDEQDAKLRDFVRSILQEREAWLIVSGAHNSDKTRLALTIMRALLRRNWRMAMTFVSVRRMTRDMKIYYNDSKNLDHPLARAIEAPFTVLDGCDLGELQDWYLKEVRELIRERWAYQRPTLITTTADGSTMQSFVGGRVPVITVTA